MPRQEEQKEGNNPKRQYLFSDASDPLKTHDFYLREVNLDEMNRSPEIKLMIANTSYRAMENLRKDPTKLDQWQKLNHDKKPEDFRQYKLGDADLPLLKDSNIKPEEMRGFVLEDQDGQPVSIILAGITRDEPLRIMMGTIDTVSEVEGRGYFSVMFDEVIKRVARENDNQLPQVLISERGSTTLGNNFDTYFHIMKSRGFKMQGIERVIDPAQSFVPANLDKALFKVDPKISAEKFEEEKEAAKKVVVSQSFQAFFMHGIPPKEMNLEKFSSDQVKRLAAKTNLRNYQWQSEGDPKNPIIALIAPSNCFDQKMVQARIDLLAANGFCVKYPQYADGWKLA